MFTSFAAVAGVVFGLGGLILGLLNYKRDRPKLLVSLRWDAILVRDQEGREATFGQIYITNVGRRPIYVTSAGVEFDPPRAWWFMRTEKQGGVRGRKLAEGDPPMSLVIDATSAGAQMLREHRRSWREFRAYAEDSNGKKYYSPSVKQCPSWGVGDGWTPDYVTDAKIIVECDLEQHELESYLIKGDWVLVSASELQRMRDTLTSAGVEVSSDDSIGDGTRIVTFLGRTGRPQGLGPP